MTVDKHSLRSSEREEYVEYIFLSQLCSYGWSIDRFVEVSRAQTDAHGYDVVLSCDDITRHVQLKASKQDGSTRYQKINVELSRKPSGCVVWIKVDGDSLTPITYGWFGEAPGANLGDLGSKIAKHTKANARGEKLERDALRQIGWSRFEKLTDISDLFTKLFGTTNNEEP